MRIFVITSYYCKVLVGRRAQFCTLLEVWGDWELGCWHLTRKRLCTPRIGSSKYRWPWSMGKIVGTQFLRQLRHPTGLWARPVIRYRSASGTYRWTTSPARAGTGERVHRYRLVGSANDKHAEVTERRVLDSITQPNEHTFSWTWTLKWGCPMHRYWSRILKKNKFSTKKITWARWANRKR